MFSTSAVTFTLYGENAGLLLSLIHIYAGTFQEVFGMLTLWPLLFYGRAVKLLSRQQEQACQVCRLMGEVELAIAAASFCAGVPGWCTTTWLPDDAGRVECLSLIHI